MMYAYTIYCLCIYIQCIHMMSMIVHGCTYIHVVCIYTCKHGCLYILGFTSTGNNECVYNLL